MIVSDASGLQPAPWIVQWAGLVAPAASVLDLAAGRGRHSIFFADRGHKVTAVDRDVSTLLDHPNIERLQADLEDGSPWPLPDRRFGAAVVTNYLHRPLFASLAAALAPNGLLIYETFALGNERFGRPRNLDFLLRPGELLDAFAALTIVAFEQGEVTRPRPAVIQRIAAVSGCAVASTHARFKGEA